MYIRECVVFLLVLCIANAAKEKYFKFEDCSKDGAIAEVPKFTVSPDPVNLDKNMTVDALVKVLRDVPDGAMLKTRYSKIKSLFGINIEVPIPCLFGMFGSCTLPFCDYLKMFKEQVEPVWPQDKPYGCPVQAGEYGGENVEIPLPDLSRIGRFIISGRYKTVIKVLEKRNGKEIGCFKIYTELK